MSVQSIAATTAAPSTATTPKRKSRVEHWWWVPEEEAARSMGVTEVPSICRRAWINLSESREVMGPEDVARGTERTDCGACVQSYWAHVRRQRQPRH